MGNKNRGGASRSRRLGLDIGKLVAWLTLITFVLTSARYVYQQEKAGFERRNEEARAAYNKRIDTLTLEVARLRKGILVIVQSREATIPIYAKGQKLSDPAQFQEDLALCEIANGDFDIMTLTCKTTNEISPAEVGVSSPIPP